ncbi:hypothetical protein C9E85_15555 [Plesiomonas shigelloides]|nr:hypothetical protein C9E85_15555 [Plesiomonas shigelloides]
MNLFLNKKQNIYQLLASSLSTINHEAERFNHLVSPSKATPIFMVLMLVDPFDGIKTVGGARVKDQPLITLKVRLYCLFHS